MFMFRSRRNALVKRLFKARLPADEADGKTEDLRSGLLKKLKEDQLETLAEAVESRGGRQECVLVEEAVGEWPPPGLVACRAWRWPDVHQEAHLRRLPHCTAGAGATCCNPYHWSRLCLPGETPRGAVLSAPPLPLTLTPDLLLTLAPPPLLPSCPPLCLSPLPPRLSRQFHSCRSLFLRGSGILFCRSYYPKRGTRRDLSVRLNRAVRNPNARYSIPVSCRV
ncbi:hypothetical protein AAG570_010400 [Ranatra chinensis]|uniref:MH1 domain-containing protein n=1 Tax=Ranatra chinensis TaxID=642074 RepID=A0ABD0YMQ1_9HEMI